MIASATNNDVRAQWLADRNTMIGASESASIFGVGYESPFAVWARKTGRVTETNEESELLECGMVLQPAIIELLRRRAQLNIVEETAWTVRRHSAIAWLGCSLDGYVTDDEGMGVIEAKNVGSYNASEWKGIEPPLRFNVQVQHQMAVTGAQWGIVVGLIGGNRLAWHTVWRDDAFIERMINALGQFWRLVESDTPPPVDGSESTARALAYMYPIDNGTAVRLPEAAATWDAELTELKAQRSRMDKSIALLEHEFKAAIGEASEGLLPGGGRYTHKAQTRKAYMCPESSFRVLRRSSK